MKKLLCLLVAFALVLSLAACGASESFSGSGTEADPYRISSAADLRLMSKLLADKETYNDYTKACYVLTCDIDVSGGEWDPIGSYLGFSGVFDGCGYTISGLKINYSDPMVGDGQRYLGLFAEVRGTVKNLTISNSTFKVNSKKSAQVGAIAGYLFKGTLENCHTTSDVTVSGTYLTGGLIGSGNGDVAITGCSNAAAVTSSANAGGIAGSSDAVITDCTNTGAITAADAAAGIVASGKNHIRDCYNSGAITADKYAGGICATFGDGALNKNENNDAVTLSGCVNDGPITAKTRPAGGITAKAETGHIADCTNNGKVTSYDGDAGGIAGFFQNNAFGTASQEFTITNCVNNGEVSSLSESGNDAAGGILGMTFRTNTRIVITDCENNGRVLSQGKKDVLDAVGAAGGIVGDISADSILIQNCVNTGEVQGVAITGGIIGNSFSNGELEETTLQVIDCTNSGSVFTVYHGGTVTMCYSGGIIGFARDSGEFPEGVFDKLEVLGCNNSGTLGCDKDPFASGDICGNQAALV